MNQIKKILTFSHHPNFCEEVGEKLNFDTSQVTACSELKEAFDLLSQKKFDVFIFQTFDCIDGNYQGLNESDLDILIYYANSNDSINRYMRFLPLDHDSAQAKKAEVVYEEFYDRYLLLLPAVVLSELKLENLFVDEERRMLFELVNTLDSACDHLDEQLTQIQGGTAQEDRHIEVINGHFDEVDQSIVRVSGKANEDETLSRVSGYVEEEESISRVSGSVEEDESFSRVSGSIAEEDDSFSRVSGSIAEEDDSFSRVCGSNEEEQGESFARISGAIKEDDSFTRIRNTTQTPDDQNVSFRVEDQSSKAQFSQTFESDSGNESNFQAPIKAENAETSQNMKVKNLGGQESHHGPEHMKVKHLEGKEREKQAPQGQHNDIDLRNKNGQTPLMIYCLKGEHEKAMDLINQGAKTSLKCKRGLSVLHYACAHSQSIGVVKYLVEIEKLKLTARDANGLDPLAIAVKSDCSETVKWLLAQGARTQAKINGLPLLHFAATHNSFQSFLILLSQGLPLHQKCGHGMTAEQFCKNKRKLPFLKALKAYSILNKKKEAA